MSTACSPTARSPTRVIPSPNHGERKDGRRPDMLILHYTGMPDEAEALQLALQSRCEVSSHYFVFENGHVAQLVPEARRAWHAGSRRGPARPTSTRARSASRSPTPATTADCPPFRERRSQAVDPALPRHRGALARSAPERVLAHSDVAPGRKMDPGERFPWERLHDAGVGHWVRPAPIRDGRFFSRGDQGQPIEALQAMLAMYGYGVPITGAFDADTEAVVAAFQRHFRPERVDGIADVSTITTLRDLIAARPTLVA